MFERFTEAAREAVVQAQVRARELGHDSVGPEHLLLGVLAGTDGPTARALREEGVDEATVRAGLAARDEATTRADADALRAIGIDLDAVREQAEAAFGPSALQGPTPRRGGLLQRLSGPHLAFEPAARQSLELALRQAVAMRHRRIGAEHVLLGLLALDGDPVGDLLGTDGDGPVSRRVAERLRTALGTAS